MISRYHEKYNRLLILLILNTVSNVPLELDKVYECTLHHIMTY